MQFLSCARIAAALTAAAAVLAIGAAPASAVDVTLTDDAGNPQAWNGEPALRHMNPTVGINYGATERGSYSATFTGPDGQGVSTPINCYLISTKRPLDFRGNGTYTVSIQSYGERDTSCRTPVGAPKVYKFSINAGVTLGGLPTRHLIRQPDTFVTLPANLPFQGNPGSVSSEIKYALNGVIGPDGGIAGPTQDGFVDSATGLVPLRFTAPGRYVAVARAKGFSTASGQFFSPWTPPVFIDAVAPFDLESFRTPDSRGPSYRVRIQIRERTARGRVSIAYARGTKGGRYRSLGSVKISSKATFTKRFTLRRSGTYRMRFKYKGSATVAPGTVVARFRVSRRFAF